MANILLGNIIEDEEEHIITKQAKDLFLMTQQHQQSRRSSRGTDQNNAISALTILEEVETDNLSNNSPNLQPGSKSNATKTSSYTISETNGDQNHFTQNQQEKSSNETQQANNNQLMATDETTELKNLSNKDFSNSVEKLDLTKIDPQSAFTTIASNRKKYSSETSCSDNSDNELKIHGLKDYDWNRSASSSARSRNRYRHSHNLPSSLNEPANKRTRPISISTDSNDLNDNLKNPSQKLPVFHTELLSNHKESAASSGCLSITSPYKQSVSSANSNDYLNNNLVSKSLSIEHRLANMSQMSINSQLSKNNSIRLRQHQSSSTETPGQQVQQMLSTTPTPRESIVFNRGEDKPIAKILLQSTKSSMDQLNSDSDSTMKSGRSSQENEFAASSLRGKELDFVKSFTSTNNFSVNNHDRPDSGSLAVGQHGTTGGSNVELNRPKKHLISANNTTR